MNLPAVFTALAVASAAASAAPATIKLAAPGLTYVGVDEKTGDFFVDYVASQLRTYGILVTTRSQIAAVIGLERQKSLLGCTESSSECLAELAGALGVDGVITGSLAKTGKGSWVINLTVVGATDGRTIASASTRVRDDDALLDWINEAARELAPRIFQQLGRGGGAASQPSATKPLPMPPPPGTRTQTPTDAPRVTPPVKPAPQVAKVEPVSAPVPAAPPTRYGIAKWAVAGAGATALVVGGALVGVAAAGRAGLDSGSTPITTRAQLNSTLADISGQQTVGVVAALVGVVGLGVGGALFFLDGPPAVQVTLAPSSAAVSVAWELP